MIRTAMTQKTRPPVSPYLDKPLRTLEEVRKTASRAERPGAATERIAKPKDEAAA